MLASGSNQAAYIRNRVNMPTDKSHTELVDIDQRIKAQSFFSARVADARILDRLRSISDSYSRGDIGLGEARNVLKDFLKGEGYDPHQAGMRNLASTARLNLIMRQNAAMAHSAGEWARMHDPDAMKIFPYVRYHSRNDSRSRSSHSKLNGNIYHKNDPFLKTHTPPWEFNCRCWLEEITAKEAGKEESRIQKPTPPDEVRVESQSGFAFDPEHAFETFDLNAIKDPEIREEVNSGINTILRHVEQAEILNVDNGDKHGKTEGVDMRTKGDLPPNANKKLRSAYRELEKNGQDAFVQHIATKGAVNKREYIAALNSDGKVLWVGIGSKNTGKAGFPDFCDHAHTMIHNHPYASPPSRADWKVLFRTEIKQMIIAVQTPNGKIGKYILKKKETGDILSENDFFEKFDKIWDFNHENYINIVKEILNDTNYEILFIG